MEVNNDFDDDPDIGGAVDGYEQLRRRALSGDTDGWRLGLGVLQQRGVAAWVRLRTAAAPAGSARPARPAPSASGGADTELVELLASMALAVAARG
ncbi:hypothetical protein C5613_35840 [Rhodococcus opacus]|uniref:Uncharacterized protein n=1 Tax=Rhodococcus opacus TaxID=37919 RepID=A0A2S8IPF2_RHOOP|nr:hypothetical protein C5613_35840 [Rhodococcus opacus]